MFARTACKITATEVHVTSPALALMTLEPQPQTQRAGSPGQGKLGALDDGWHPKAASEHSKRPQLELRRGFQTRDLDGYVRRNTKRLLNVFMQ